MGRTIATTTQVLLEEQQAFSRFRRALRKEDQLVFDELFARVHRHLPAISLADHALPFEAILLAMLVESWGEQRSLANRLAQLEQALAAMRPKDGGG